MFFLKSVIYTETSLCAKQENRKIHVIIGRLQELNPVPPKYAGVPITQLHKTYNLNEIVKYIVYI